MTQQRRLLLGFAFLGSCLLLLTWTALGQVQVQLRGQVHGPDGSVLPGVMISAQGLTGGFSAITDGQGQFVLRLPPGVYRVEASLKGFAVTSKEVRVLPGVMQSLNIEFDVEPPPPPPVNPRPPPSPPPVEPRSKPVNSLFWNSWVVDGESPTQLVAEDKIGVGVTIEVSFDLAPYLYEAQFPGIASLSGVKAGDDLARFLEDFNKDELKVLVYPIVSGQGLRLLDDQKAFEPISINLKKLRRVIKPRQAQEEPLEFAKRVQVTETISVRVFAEEKGCAGVSLSIWRPAGDPPQPLDFVSRRVVVADTAGNRPECAKVPRAEMTAGLLEMLALDSPMTIDASLFVFEPEKSGSINHKSRAILVLPDGPIHHWRTTNGVTWLLDEPDGLRSELDSARKGRGYRKVSERLTSALFSGASDARDALAKVRGLAAIGRRPRIAARMVDARGTVRPVPLGFLDDGEGKYLGERVDVIHALPATRLPDGARCIKNWTFVLPASLAEDTIGGCPATVPTTTTLTNWEDFESFYKDPTSSAETYGLVVLAHQRGNRLGESLALGGGALPSDWKRPMRPGSAIFLVACDTADVEALEGGWVAKLNREFNVDAAIASPFPVYLRYGTCFARQMAQEISTAQSKGEAATILELFQRANARIAEALPNVTKKFAPAAHELVILGDPSLRLCRPDGS